jgi:regulator of protease activity HflC (stomatin/prohibitin superfamily)
MTSDTRGNVAAGTVIAIITAAVLSGAVWLIGSENPETPAGYVGYLTQGALFGETQFWGVQTGPSSPGRTWMLYVVNVSITPYTYTEPFEGPGSVLSKDRLSVQFSVHVTWKVRADRVREFVEKYAYGDSSSPDRLVLDAYKNFLQEPLRSFARDEVQKLHSMDISDQMTAIGQRVYARVLVLTKDTPFDVSQIVVGNIQFPDEVTKAVSNKMAAQQLLAQQQTEVDIAKKKAEIRVADAQGVADAMNIINARLTAAYLQHEAIDAQRQMVGSPNHTTIYIPVGPMGVPVVGTFLTDAQAPAQAAPATH